MTTIEDKAKVMTEGRLGRQEGACALKSHMVLPLAKASVDMVDTDYYLQAASAIEEVSENEGE